MSIAEAFAAPAMRSAIFGISLADKENWFIALLAIAAASGRAISPAAARATVASAAPFRTSGIGRPALMSSSIAEDASVAEKAVSLPIWRALARTFSISPVVAPDTAWILDKPFSKSAATLTAPTNA